MEKRKYKKYTEEFRCSSAKLAIESDLPISTTAKNLGVSGVTLHEWIKRYTSNSSGHEPSRLPTQQIDLLNELNKLKKENARLKMERDILKKATAYFASDTL